MKLKISLSTSHTEKVNLNYHYNLSAAIYNLLRFGSPEFSNFLHEIGYSHNGRTYKLFCFALDIPHFKISGENLVIEPGEIYLHITSPLIDSFITNLINGSFIENKLKLRTKNELSEFLITGIEVSPEPVFREKDSFILKSPIVLSTVKEYNSQRTQYYFRYNDDINEINRVLNQNLSNKYLLINNQEYKGKGVILQWDKAYIDQRLKRNKRITKKISVTKSGEPPVNIIGNQLPFFLSGDTELMKIGYQAGFGEKNSMGFGLTDVR